MHQTLYWQTAGGEARAYRYWRAAPHGRRGAILLIQLGPSQAVSADRLVADLALDSFEVLSHDLPACSAYAPVFNAAELALAAAELQDFCLHLAKAHQLRSSDLYVVAGWQGMPIAVSWLRAHRPPIRGMSLETMPQDGPHARWLARTLATQPGFARSTRAWQSDPTEHDESLRHVVRAARDVQAPLQLLIPLRDADAQASRSGEDIGTRAGQPIRACVQLPTGGACLLASRHRGPALEALRQFVRKAFAINPSPQMQSESSPSTGRWRRALLMPGTGLVRRCSRGLRLLHERGFQSGPMLDYIYQDRAQGLPLLGSAVDRLFLSSPYCRALRQRKDNVAQLLRRAMRVVARAGLPVRIFDPAAGLGRYVFDALHETEVVAEHVLLRDRCRHSVAAGLRLIANRRLEGLVRYEHGDALAPTGHQRLIGSVSIAVVSGLYEEVGDPEQVLASLRALAEATVPGGFLIYTGQLKAAAEARPDLDWASRPSVKRPQAALDRLVVEAGFRQLTRRADDTSMLSVTLAQRRWDR